MEGYIELAMDHDICKLGFPKYISWSYLKHPHMVIFGSTGSGKTYLLKIILARIGIKIPLSELIICDYKSDMDFEFLFGKHNFYRYDKCMDGLQRVIKILNERQMKTDSSNHFVMLVFDEWASFINSLDKKQAEKAKQDLSILLMLGRSFNIHVLISQQRLDASYFSTARDNFSVVIGMGVLSKESVEMMFSDYKDKIERNKDRGTGSIIIGNQFKNIIVPKVQNVSRLTSSIIEAVDRFSSEQSL